MPEKNEVQDVLSEENVGAEVATDAGIGELTISVTQKGGGEITVIPKSIKFQKRYRNITDRNGKMHLPNGLEISAVIPSDQQTGKSN